MKYRASLVVQMVKNFACNAVDLVLIPESERSLGEGIATYSSILTWRIPWTEDPGELTLHTVAKSQTQLSN